MKHSIHTEVATRTEPTVEQDALLTAHIGPDSPTRERLDLIPAVCEYCGDDEISVHRNRPVAAVVACVDCARTVAGGKSGTVLRRPVPKRTATSPVQLGTMSDAQVGQVVRQSLEADLTRRAMVERARAVRRIWRMHQQQGLLIRDEQMARQLPLPGLLASDGLPGLPDLDAAALAMDEIASPALVEPYRIYCRAKAGKVPPSLAGEVTNRQVVGLHLVLTNTTN